MSTWERLAEYLTASTTGYTAPTRRPTPLSPRWPAPCVHHDMMLALATAPGAVPLSSPAQTTNVLR